MASTVLARKLSKTIIGKPRRRGCAVPYAGARCEFHSRAGRRGARFLAYRALSPAIRMITLRVTRHDRNEALLAECQSSVIPARGEVLQLDTLEADGSMVRPSTMWRVVAVTVHVPSLQSAAPIGSEPLRVRTVEVSVLPDVSLLPMLEE